MQERSTRTTASVGSRNAASGTSSTRTSWAPYIRVARMFCPYPCWGPPVRVILGRFSFFGRILAGVRCGGSAVGVEVERPQRSEDERRILSADKDSGDRPFES